MQNQQHHTAAAQLHSQKILFAAAQLPRTAHFGFDRAERSPVQPAGNRQPVQGGSGKQRPEMKRLDSDKVVGGGIASQPGAAGSGRRLYELAVSVMAGPPGSVFRNTKVCKSHCPACSTS